MVENSDLFSRCRSEDWIFSIGSVTNWMKGGEKVQLSNCQNIAAPSKPKTCNVCHLLCTFSNWKARNIMSIYFVDNTNAIRSYENFLSIISRFMTFIILSQTFYLVYTHFHMLEFKYIQKCDTEIVINCTRGLEKFSYILQRCPYILFYRQRYVIMGGIFYENGNLPQIGNTGVLLSAKPLVPSRTLFKFMEEKLGLASVRNKIRSGIGSPTTNSTRTSGDWIFSLSPRPTFSLVLNFSISFRKYNFPGYITIKMQCSLLTMSIVWIVQTLDMRVSLILCVDSV